MLRLEPRSVDALYHRGTIFEKLGSLDDAIRDFSGVLTLDPNHVKAGYARGACRNLKGEFFEAIGAAGARLRARPAARAVRVLALRLPTPAVPPPPATHTAPHHPPPRAEDYRYALERDRKPPKNRRPSLREGLLTRGAAAAGAASGVASLTISTANSVTGSSEFGGALASGRDEYGAWRREERAGAVLGAREHTLSIR